MIPRAPAYRDLNAGFGPSGLRNPDSAQRPRRGCDASPRDGRRGRAQNPAIVGGVCLCSIRKARALDTEQITRRALQARIACGRGTARSRAPCPSAHRSIHSPSPLAARTARTARRRDPPKAQADSSLPRARPPRSHATSPGPDRGAAAIRDSAIIRREGSANSALRHVSLLPELASPRGGTSDHGSGQVDPALPPAPDARHRAPRAPGRQPCRFCPVSPRRGPESQAAGR